MCDKIWEIVANMRKNWQMCKKIMCEKNLKNCSKCAKKLSNVRKKWQMCKKLANVR